MNYRHHFHAGNFADVFKHIILVAVLEKLQEKSTPLTYLETHAGRGLYYLHSRDTQKLQEYRFGIEALMEYAKAHPAPAAIQRYLDVVDMFFTAGSNSKFYPGSPKIAETFMRENDKMILCELHPEEFNYLKENMARRDRLVSLQNINGYSGLKAFIPPRTPRGIVLIDPPFEKKNEFEMIDAALAESLKRWRMGQFLIWYPIKDKKVVEKFQKTLNSYSTENVCIDFYIKNQEVTSNLMGCGMAMVNPPWKIKEQLVNEVLPYLSMALSGEWRI